MSTLTTSSETVGISIQDFPAELLEMISGNLDWVSRARCQMTCKAFYQNMRQEHKDEEEAYKFYYNVLHGRSLPFLYYPIEWASNFRRVSVYAIFLHNIVHVEDVPCYEKIVATVFMPKVRKTPSIEIHMDFDGIVLRETEDEYGKRQIVTGLVVEQQNFHTHRHTPRQKRIVQELYRKHVPVKFIKYLRWFLFANAEYPYGKYVQKHTGKLGGQLINKKK